MDPPPSLTRDISPPRAWKRRKLSQPAAALYILTSTQEGEPTLAAIEAGKAKIDDHFAYFTNRLSISSRQTASHVARLPIEDFAALYNSNDNEHGNHFVVHQHNHPRAGVHYDLRLQFSKSSSISFALPKGLPGNPNSRSIGRMAIETRVHNYWNHLIESASSKTGSLLIWDTGTYEVLPRKTAGRSKRGIPSPQTTDDESDPSDSSIRADHPKLNSKFGDSEHENEKLVVAFKSRYIRLRLHGTRLPNNYTVILRLPTNEIIKRPAARRKGTKVAKVQRVEDQADSDAEGHPQPHEQDHEEDLDTDTDEDAQTRATNAYPGSHNTIGSVHQRHWFLQLDRQNSGFVLDRSDTHSSKGTWIRGRDGGGFEPFIVRGRDHERSVVTGRLAREVESDEGVEGYVGRGGWVGIEH
ncbi:DNA polymerase ligase-domain-containing protein [Phaeosphaeria sp. MPI-PUGE-AT-0046c]|nr:DNA polymerase ligase-domain-containing protein [Phaeosphaeria sp. MPI-PUGE-AT-0046c]